MEDSENKTQFSHLSQDLVSSSFESKHHPRRSEPARLMFSCDCRICQLTSLNISSFSSNTQAQTCKKAFGFTWLVEKLGAISQSYSFKLNIPDTAVFHKGKVSFFLQFQRDRTLKFLVASEKLTNQEVIKQIINLVRIRKREESPIKGSKASISPLSTEQTKETACIRFMSKGKDNDLDEIFADDEQGAMKVMNESEFTGLMWQRAGSTLWKTIRYMQGVLKCNKGIGESFIHFYRFHDCDSADYINAGMDENEENEESIFLASPKKYCEFIFKKLRYLIEKFMNVVILQIKGEFVRDKNCRIWLIHASDILVTEGNFQKTEEKIETKAGKEELKGDVLLQHLASVAKQPKNSRTERFSGILNKECQKIILESGVLNTKDLSDPEPINSLAFSKLRKFAPYKLDELLDNTKVKVLLKEYKDHGTQKIMRKGIKGVDYDRTDPVKEKVFNLSQTFNRTPRTNYTQRSRMLSTRRRLSVESTFSL